ncbi:MAG: hypothetical protein LBO69_01985 [Ignavibacteria bacterium]|jgi:glycerol-3-phosphate responsive antiterminator|nr:hypothetical protein [Ignavibacteria bacterium]
MAKVQTFSDKLKSKKTDTRIPVKIIKGFSSEIGSTRFLEKVVKVDDLNQLSNIDIN